MFDLHNEWREAKKGFYCLWVCWSRERERENEKKERERGECCVSGRGGGRFACLCSWRLIWGGLGWFRCGLGWFICGLGLTWQVNVIKMLLNVFFKY